MTEADETSRTSATSVPLRRRTHRKSRMGCKACKTSRIKCDETRPVCKNCHRRDAFCEYFATLRTRESTGKSVEIIPKQMQSCTKSTPITSPKSTIQTRISLTLYAIFDTRTSSLPERLFELQLLQHFIDMTKRTTKFQATWSFWILEQATQSISVMDAILGTAASHLQNLGKFETKLLFISHRYMARAIEVHKRDLDEGVNESNTARLFATCILICMHANLRAYSIESERNQRQPHDWFISCRKVLNLFNGVSPIIENPSIIQELSSLSCIIPYQIHTNPFSFLLHWKSESGSIHQQEIEICTTAVAQLSYIYANIVTEKPLRFTVAVSESFVDLVVAKNPRALAICGYFYMLVRQGRQIWWIDGAPEREFDLVMSCLPNDWRPVMDWAVRVFHWNDRVEEP